MHCEIIPSLRPKIHLLVDRGDVNSDIPDRLHRRQALAFVPLAHSSSISVLYFDFNSQNFSCSHLRRDELKRSIDKDIHRLDWINSTSTFTRKVRLNNWKI